MKKFVVAFQNPEGKKDGVGILKLTVKAQNREIAVKSAKKYIWEKLNFPKYVCVEDGTSGVTAVEA